MPFNNYSEMPIKVKGGNPWFNKHIRNLSLIDIDANYVVKINKHNSDIIEHDINQNGSYNSFFTKKIYMYYLSINHGNFPRYDMTAITDLIRMIDLENSTNIWRYKNKRPFITNMVDYIINKNTNFWDRLAKGDPILVDDLRSASKAKTEGPKSLASKICKYFSELFYGKDNYYINDTVVRHVLPYYLNYYGLNLRKKTKSHFEHLSYVDLYNYMDKIKEKVNNSLTINNSLTKSNIDHIMWYCYRFEK